MMPGAQQVAQMRQARPTGMQQQVRPSMTARPITGQQAVPVPARAPGGSLSPVIADNIDYVKKLFSLHTL